MKKILILFVLIFPFILKAQTDSLKTAFVAKVTFDSVSVINDSVLQFRVKEWSDALFEGYLPSQIEEGFGIIDGSGRLFRIDTILSTTLSIAKVRAVKLQQRTTPDPTGVGAVFEFLSNGMIPAGVANNLNLTPATISRISIHNAVIASAGEGGSGVTNLTYTASPTNGIVVSNTGTDATIPATDGTNAGLLLPAEKTAITNLPTTYFPLLGGSLTGTAGAGFHGFIPQSSDPSAPASGFRLFADNTGRFAWENTNGFRSVLNSLGITANRDWTLPDASGAFVTTASLPAGYLPFSTTNSQLTGNNQLLVGGSGNTRVQFGNSFGSFAGRLQIRNNNTNHSYVGLLIGASYSIDGAAESGSFFTTDGSGNGFSTNIINSANEQVNYPSLTTLGFGGRGTVGLVTGATVFGIRTSVGHYGYASTNQSVSASVNQAMGGFFMARREAGDLSTGGFYRGVTGQASPNGSTSSGEFEGVRGQATTSNISHVGRGGFFTSTGTGSNTGASVSASGTGNNTGLEVSASGGASNIAINSTSGINTFADSSNFNNDVRINHIVGGGTISTVVAQAGSGTSAIAALNANSKDAGGRVTFTTGTGAITRNTAWVRITFNRTYDTAPFVALTPSGTDSDAGGQNAANSFNRFYIKATTTYFEIWTIDDVSVELLTSLRFDFNYIIIQ